MNFLLEDSSLQKVPKLLEDVLLKISENESLTQEDIFFLLIIILMVENGFQPILNDGDEWDGIKPIDKDQISHWKATGRYEVSLVMSGFKEMPIQLIVCPIGTTVAINLLINDDVYSIFLVLNRYIVSPKLSTIPMIFSDLKHLTNAYKNKIIVPAKSRILNFYGFPSASLEGLPAEVFFYLLLHLPLNGILNMATTCKRIRSIIETDNFWHKLFIRDYKITNEEDEISITKEDEISWKSRYIEKYNEEQEKKMKVCQIGRLTGLVHRPSPQLPPSAIDFDIFYTPLSNRLNMY